MQRVNLAVQVWLLAIDNMVYGVYIWHGAFCRILQASDFSDTDYRSGVAGDLDFIC